MRNGASTTTPLGRTVRWLSSAGTGQHRWDGPKSDNTLIFNMDHPMGDRSANDRKKMDVVSYPQTATFVTCVKNPR